MVILPEAIINSAQMIYKLCCTFCLIIVKSLSIRWEAGTFFFLTFFIFIIECLAILFCGCSGLM